MMVVAVDEGRNKGGKGGRKEGRMEDEEKIKGDVNVTRCDHK
jgi:hypothetical protein